MNRCAALTISAKRCKLTTPGKYCRFHTKKQDTSRGALIQWGKPTSGLRLKTQQAYPLCSKKHVSFIQETKFVENEPKTHRVEEHEEDAAPSEETSALLLSQTPEQHNPRHIVDTKEGRSLSFILYVLYVILFLVVALFICDDLVSPILKEYTMLFIKDKYRTFLFTTHNLVDNLLYFVFDYYKQITI